MTIEQKISILIRKYGSKSIIVDNNNDFIGTENSFSENRVLPQQIWLDLKTAPKKNPLRSNPVNLSVWPNNDDPVIVKIIKKPLTWIPGTTAFYDPSDPSDISTVRDIINPQLDISYSPYVYVLNTQSNRYLHNISPNEYGWVFDYESGCLVFLNGFPSFMKSPQFQPPAITCYRYVGRKTATGIGVDLTQGSTGPTGPTGPTGDMPSDALLWKGQYNTLQPYAVNDTVYNDGIIWVKTTGPTGPTDITSAYFDSITYNELIDGFFIPLNEQYVDTSYVANSSPYFSGLNQLTTALNAQTAAGAQIRNNDQNINVFSISGLQAFGSTTPTPYSNRLLFHNPEKLTSALQVYLQTAGYRVLSLEGLYSSNSTITTQSNLHISRSRLSGSGNIQFFANSSGVIPGKADITSSITDTLFSNRDVILNGSTNINSSDFQGCNIIIGDPGFNRPQILDAYAGTIHYFQNTHFSNTTFELAYTGEYGNPVIVFNRCRISELRVDFADAGFRFPNRPDAFSLDNPKAKLIKLVFIDCTITSENSAFNLIDGSIMVVIGTNVFPQRINPPQNTRGIAGGTITQDLGFNQYLDQQNTYSDVNPRATTNFFFNP